MNVFTVETKNGFTRWNLSPECEREIRPLADQFGLSLKKFLYLYTNHALPGQLVRGNDMDGESTPPSFRSSPCADPATWDRVKRAAKHDCLSIKAFVWRAVASSVDCVEEDMILSPTTGNPIASCDLINQFMHELQRHEI